MTCLTGTSRTMYSEHKKWQNSRIKIYKKRIFQKNWVTIVTMWCLQGLNITVLLELRQVGEQYLNLILNWRITGYFGDRSVQLSATVTRENTPKTQEPKTQDKYWLGTNAAHSAKQFQQAVQKAATICRRPCKFWPFNLVSGVRVTCDVAYLCANFSLPRPLCSRLMPDVPNRQT